MATSSDSSELSPVKRALVEIRSLRAKLQEAERAGHEPIAVVGMALRFPGADDPDSFWRLLSEGRSAITEVPRSRWDIDQYYDPDPAAPGKMYVRWGGFLDRVNEFDAGFFGIHAREAASMDPQQRLMLEVAWEALENAAQSPAQWSESPTGVFLGISNSDYQRLLMADLARIDAYTGTGGVASVAAGRLSYQLGLQGPSLVVDTSCSSSLMAIHLAARSLRSRECNMALAGGASLMLTPDGTIALSRARMLAPDGRCKTFDEAADGYSRAEGCGLVVLKRLADALADGDFVHAIIRGSAVNQDGRSGGLTVPSGPAQEAVIRAALADAQLEPSAIGYVEAHGTGTSLGDPIEIHALISALRAGREADRPLYVGSLKTNLGHMEAASGVGGFIKAVLALERKRIPAHLNFRTLNPHIELQGAQVRIPVESTPWVSDGSRSAGVSSFGFSGTNVHVIVEEAPAPAPSPSDTGQPGVLMLSARTPQALAALARRYAAWFETHPQLSLADVCFTALNGRKHFECKAAWTADSLPDLQQKLEAFAAAGPSDPWPEAPTASAGRRIPLPTYAFERSRYWLEEPGESRWHSAINASREQALQIPAELDMPSHDARWERLESLTTAAIVEALRELGAPLVPGERLTPESLRETTGTLPKFERLLSRWLKHLAAQGRCVSVPGGDFIPLAVPASPAREELTAGFQTDDPVLEYAANCARQLPAILRGRQNPLETLFPGGDSSLAERLYERSPLSLYFNSIVGAAVAAAGRAGSKTYRILEVGAGTGATSASVLPLLSSTRAEYWFTDLSNLFLNRAKRKFHAFPFVHYGLLDLECDPAGQGYAPGSFDVVLATNVLHATADLPRTLAHVRSLLAPGGMLVLCEATRYFPWFDITTALIEGWQRYDDGLRQEHPLLTADQWTAALQSAGFAAAQAFPGDGSATEMLGQHVIVAQASANAPAVTAGPAAIATPVGSGFRSQLTDTQPSARLPVLVEFVRERLAAVLGVDAPNAISSTQRLMDLGLDSLMVLDFREALERGLDLKGRLSSTLAFDFPTIEAVAAYLEREIFGTESAPVERRDPAPLAGGSEPLAIVGAACRLPGGADDLDSFWNLLATGTDAVSEIPRDRWKIDEWYDPDPDVPGKMATRWGGFLKGIDQFDPGFFGIAPREAESMDPQQRLLLEVSWEALENAGQNPSGLGTTRTGVFVGLASDDYARLLSPIGDLSSLDAYFASGVARSVAAGRISYVLGLQGPSLSIDTACSSSLVAVHQACQSLRAGECRMALAGGANIVLAPETSVALSRSKMMAPDGRCKAFDDSADGFVRGEGCVILVLKRLASALEDHDRILAVIRGSAINQDGRSSGLTVPNGPAQEAVIRQALADAGVPPSAVEYVEAHGTGTSLGDPIEVHALVAALGEGRDADNPLRLGSVKSNIGHAESAAGAAGLLKAVLALSHGAIPPTLHFQQWNRNIDLKGVPITVPVALTPWTTGTGPRIAGVSAFGFSGTNAHLVLEEAPAPPPVSSESAACVLRLSARSEASLRLLAQRYCTYFELHPSVSLADVCDTTASGRAQFDWCLEVTAESVAEMRARLAEAAAGSFTVDHSLAPLPTVLPRQRVALPLTPFERQRYWRPDGLRRSLLGRRMTSPAFSQIVFENSLREWPAYLAQHRVAGKPILPMSGYLEILLAASGGQALEDVLVLEPLQLEGNEKVQVVVNTERLELYRSAGDAWHLCGSARPAPPGRQPAQVSVTGLRALTSQSVDPAAHYAFLRERGIDLGPAYQLVRELYAGTHQSLGRIGGAGVAGQAAVMDAWIQVLAAALSSTEDVYLPTGIERFELFREPVGDLWSSVTVSSFDADTITANIHVVDDDGYAVASFQALRLRRAARRPSDGCLYEPVWRPKGAVASSPSAVAGHWVVFADDGRVGMELAVGLERAGAVCRMVKRGELASNVLTESDLTGVVYLWALDAPAASQRDICGGVLDLVRELTARGEVAPPRLIFATRGAQTIGGERDIAVWQAPLWGLARTLRLEHPEFDCVSVDLDPADTNPAETLLREIRLPDRDAEIAWRGPNRLVAGLARIEGTCNRLEIANRGSFDNLQLNSTARRKPAAGEVEIRVAAAALNFRDVLNALGEYPGDPGPLGAECSGRIVEVGDGVSDLTIGESVIAIARGALGTYLTVPADLVGRKPAGLSMEEAAALPVAYVTARYALHHAARIQAGDRVLIHAAAGGVGLAAVAEAQRAGAEIFATAGSEEKRAYLRSLGIAHVMDSRTLNFAGEILHLTEGRGVDVILNSLSGRFVDENVRVLAPGGRYLELSKNGIWDSARFLAERPDARYFLLDWGEEYRREPQTIVAIFRQVLQDAEAGLVQPLPCRRFPITDAQAAFRWMAQGRHIGKVVLSVQLVRGDATYLITGGLGGLGLRVAEWLVDYGARHLTLVGRNTPDQTQQRALLALQERGVHLTVHRADVSRREDMQAIFDTIRREGPPLAGVVHSAGVLDNAVLTQMSWDKFAPVLMPKVDGSWYLHEVTADLPLDFFVLFSSLASLLGAPGQANHAAANSFMDALAHQRRALGLTAVSINWGPWSDIGAASGDKSATHLAGRGIASLTPAEGLELFELALTTGRTQFAAARMDCRETQQAVRHLAGLPLRGSSETAPVGKLRAGTLLDEVRRRACRVLGLPADHPINPDTPLSDLGLDSLMAVELRNSLSTAVGKPLPSTLVFSYPGTGALAEYLATQVLDPEPPPVAQPEDGDFLSRLEQLSDDEVARLLSQAAETIA